MDQYGYRVLANPGFDFFFTVWFPVGLKVAFALVVALGFTLIPVTVRRLHDAGFSGWAVLFLGGVMLPFSPSSSKGFIYDQAPTSYQHSPVFSILTASPPCGVPSGFSAPPQVLSGQASAPPTEMYRAVDAGGFWHNGSGEQTTSAP
ncbi:DUF805 domain-containing protein [Rothia terrae]|uniref:DUF805 domain-containing protein n=1 Tax=Rothia terrae TaxID=396015 RepID=UPI003404565E